MRKLQTDLSIFNKLNLEKPPVGVKFVFHKPEDIEPLGKQLALCEMLGEAQRGRAFYMSKEDESCFGKAALGMMDESLLFVSSGEFGVKLELFQDARANKRLFLQNPGLTKGSVNHVVFAPLDKITFDPDVLVVMAKPRQAEIVLRAMTYSTGELYESRSSTALSCAWLYVYPYITGKLNFYMTGLGFGSIGRQVFEPGWVLIGIPYNWLDTIVKNLNEMKWELTAYTLSKEEFPEWEKKILNELSQEMNKPNAVR